MRGNRAGIRRASRRRPRRRDVLLGRRPAGAAAGAGARRRTGRPAGVGGRHAGDVAAAAGDRRRRLLLLPGSGRRAGGGRLIRFDRPGRVRGRVPRRRETGVRPDRHRSRVLAPARPARVPRRGGGGARLRPRVLHRGRRRPGVGLRRGGLAAAPVPRPRRGAAVGRGARLGRRRRGGVRGGDDRAGLPGWRRHPAAVARDRAVPGRVAGRGSGAGRAGFAGAAPRREPPGAPAVAAGGVTRPRPILHTGAMGTVPDAVAPMLAVDGSLPDDDQHGYEWKWDGFRGCARVAATGEARITSRSGSDHTHRYPELQEIFAPALGGHAAVLDGEVVALNAAGRPEFELMQRRAMHEPTAKLRAEVPVVYFAFDLLRIGSESLLDRPYEQRRELLAELVRPADGRLVVPPWYTRA